VLSDLRLCSPEWSDECETGYAENVVIQEPDWQTGTEGSPSVESLAVYGDRQFPDLGGQIGSNQ
jgi:hypothetical protein